MGRLMKSYDNFLMNTDPDERNSSFHKNSSILASMMLSADTEENMAFMQDYPPSDSPLDADRVHGSNPHPCIVVKDPSDYPYISGIGCPPSSMTEPLGHYPHHQEPVPLISTKPIGPYDIVEFRATSIHSMKENRECLRIIAVAAGENLHNLYRVLMSALCQREDRARLVFHAWVLPDGSVYGNGSRSRESTNITKSLHNDREIYLNQLPIHLGYQLQLVFGKCVYSLVVQDLLLGINNEQDLIWTPRVCEGSYGEAVPFDLCYSPHLFRSPSPQKHTPLKKNRMSLDSGENHDTSDLHLLVKSEDNDGSFQEAYDSHESASPIKEDKILHLRPSFKTNYLLSSAELDDINRNLSRMRFIRQYSQIKPLVRKNRPEDYIPDDEKRRHCFRMTMRIFFSVLWSRYSTPPASTLDTICLAPYIHAFPMPQPDSSFYVQHDGHYPHTFMTPQNPVTLHGCTLPSQFSHSNVDDDHEDMTSLKIETPQNNELESKTFEDFQNDSLEKDLSGLTPLNSESVFSQPLQKTLGTSTCIRGELGKVMTSPLNDSFSQLPLDGNKTCIDFVPQLLSLRSSYPRCRVSKRHTANAEATQQI